MLCAGFPAGGRDACVSSKFDNLFEIQWSGSFVTLSIRISEFEKSLFSAREISLRLRKETLLIT